MAAPGTIRGKLSCCKKGFYAEEGLKVNLVPFSFEDPTIDAVADGKAVFGITGADELILARAKGIPIRAFAVIFKTNPVCAYSLEESGISKPMQWVVKSWDQFEALFCKHHFFRDSFSRGCQPVEVYARC